MKLKLKRICFKDTYTIGRLYIDDKYFCDTLEDKNRDLNKNGKFDNGEVKVYSETCIPFGTYNRELPWIQNVPSFSGILIHRGTTSKNTSGCVLVGENKIVGKLINSASYEIKLVTLIKEAITKGDKITIEIV